MINVLHKLHHGGFGLLDPHGPGVPQPERALGQEDRLQDRLDGRRLHVLWEAPCTYRASPLHQSPQRARGHGASGADRGAGGSPRRTWAAGPWANATLEQRRGSWSSGSDERDLRAPAASGRPTRRPFLRPPLLMGFLAPTGSLRGKSRDATGPSAPPFVPDRGGVTRRRPGQLLGKAARSAPRAAGRGASPSPRRGHLWP